MSDDYLRKMYFRRFSSDLRRLVPCQLSNDCDTNTQICDNGYCQCLASLEFDENGECVPCPGYGQACTECCYSPAYVCSENICKCVSDVGNLFRSHSCSNQALNQSGVFITASQIALSVALIMGIIALAMVIYRLCTKPRYLSARALSANRQFDESMDRSYSNYLRASLTSIQIRVLTSMQDRPPSYWIRSARNEGRPASNSAQPELPPSYEGSENLETHLPPPYTEIILSPTGYVNSSFVDVDTPQVVNVIRRNEDQENKDTTSNGATASASTSG